MIRITDLFRWVAATLPTLAALAPRAVPVPVASPSGKHGCVDPLRRQHRRLRTVLSVSPQPWKVSHDN